MAKKIIVSVSAVVLAVVIFFAGRLSTEIGINKYPILVTGLINDITERGIVIVPTENNLDRYREAISQDMKFFILFTYKTDFTDVVGHRISRDDLKLGDEVTVWVYDVNTNDQILRIYSLGKAARITTNKVKR